MTEYERITKCADILRKAIGDFTPRIGLVLGSGLGAFADNAEVIAAVSYRDIDGFPVSTVSGHKGKLIFCRIRGVNCVIMQGRVHFYEGYRMSDCVLPVRVMKLLGCDTVILTNAAGGINRSFSPGDIMMISGHISSFVPSPLIGADNPEIGERFPDMSDVYDRALREKIKKVTASLLPDLKEGTYIQVSGPNYETPEEIKMFGILGADAVGMSTVCEAMAAHHAGLRVIGFSCITNMACGICEKPLSHSEVKEVGDSITPRFSLLIEEAIDIAGKG